MARIGIDSLALFKMTKIEHQGKQKTKNFEKKILDEKI